MSDPKISQVRMTGPQATALAAVCSLVSAATVAWITGAFEQSTAQIETIKAQAVEQIKQEGTAKVEEIKQITAKLVEQSKAEGNVKIEQFKLQRDLILKAIETLDREEAQKRLKFFAETGLIPDFADKVIAFTTKKSVNEIPTIAQEELVRLRPLMGRHESLANALVILVAAGNPICGGVALSDSRALLMKHCLQDDIENYQVKYKSKLGWSKSTIESTEGIETHGQQKFSQDMSLVHLSASNLQYKSDIVVRSPNLGESVFIIGYAPRSHIAFRSLVSEKSFALFISEGCAIKEVNSKQGFLSTDCPSTSGTSGNPIFAASDGALLSVVSWGRNPRETNGPILSKYRQQL